jgi:predicted ferric reductase
MLHIHFLSQPADAAYSFSVCHAHVCMSFRIWLSNAVSFKVAQITAVFVRNLLAYFSVLKKNDTLKPHNRKIPVAYTRN